MSEPQAPLTPRVPRLSYFFPAHNEEANLAALAADLGFVDQSHMVRVLRRSTGMHPSGLRRWFHEACLPPLEH